MQTQAQADLSSADDLSVFGYVATIAFLSALVFGLLLPIGLLIWEGMAATGAVRSGDAGRFVSATASQGGFFSGTLSSVRTTQGSITVVGTFSAPRGRALAIEDLNKSGLHLCAVGDFATCMPLAGPWSGQLEPTRQADDVFHFGRYGLRGDNLWRWLMLGMLGALFSMVAVGLSVSAKRSE